MAQDPNQETFEITFSRPLNGADRRFTIRFIGYTQTGAKEWIQKEYPTAKNLKVNNTVWKQT